MSKRSRRYHDSVSDVSVLSTTGKPPTFRVPRRQHFGEAWERQKGEPAPAFAAFRAFRDLGDKRSIDAVAEANVVAVRKATLQRWSSIWNWAERAGAYDRMLDRRRVEAAAKEVEAMTQRHIQTGMVLQQRGLEYVHEHLDTAEKRRRLTPTNALRFIELGAQLERRARGVEQEAAEDRPAGHIEVSVKVELFGRITQMAENHRAVSAMAPNGVITTGIAPPRTLPEPDDGLGDDLDTESTDSEA